ncbi:hypothetical protein N474_21485 [Pseudoalteromonas luteoviolacea CPMOR-2]|uniref:putative porin n=1 Tax=Pseudoalteromonas luteoviolacea TaxID=43657 RepID=UPI0007B168F7|nr:putative porin [Pseudoalteromonas luteoviolacea]KZN53286.1 hypothetical protein N474_21485 [Pseudoalteromonas luteoviolacea CPMOR-2]
MKILIILTITLCSSLCIANTEKTWFNQATYTKFEDADDHSWQISSHYYFAPQAYFGVWDDFGYLDTDSNVLLTYTNDTDVYTGAEGEMFIGNWFIPLGIADLSQADEDYSVGVGHLFYDRIKASISHQRLKNGEDITWFQGQLNIDLDPNAYIGLTANTDDSLDDWRVEVRYFRGLGEQRFFTLDLSHHNNSSKNQNDFIANYYFNQHFALGVGSQASHLMIEGKYFVNHSFFVKARYQEQSDDEQSLEMSMQAQF